MNVSSVQPPSRTENIPLERLVSADGLSEDQKLGEASRQFEAVLLRQILSEGRKPIFASKLTSQSATSGIYHDMVTNQLADSISKSGEFGLARSLQQQIASREGLPASGPVPPAPPAALKNSL